MIILSGIKENGERCKVEDFTSRKQYNGNISEILKIPLTEIKNIPNINDGNIYEWYVVGSGKYGRLMYCPKTKILRGLTMGEFYENATVD
jgi:hypothetical protein